MGISQLIKTALKGVLLMPLVAIALALLWLIFTILNKAYWDAWVTRMCTSTDLVTVFETVDLRDPDNRYISLDINGIPIIPFENARELDDPFYIKLTSNIVPRFGGLNTGNYLTEIFKFSDNSLVSRGLWYSRTGGDAINYGGPGSTFSCLDLGHDARDIYRKTFTSDED